MTPGFAVARFATAGHASWKPLVTNERNYRSNDTIEGERTRFSPSSSRKQLVTAPREEFSSPRSIMKRACRILGHGSRGLGNTDGEKVKSVADANAKRDLMKYSLVASCVSEAAMCNNNNASSSSHVSPDPSKFFPAVNGNLTKIVWAHAVNSVAELDKALSSEDIMMLEADVVVGKLNSSNQTDIPIMAHPPAVESDLSLENFLDLNIQSNKTKGIKLDFKSNQAFEISKPILAKLRANLTFPVFLNADILPGPVNATTTPLNAKDFLKGANETLPESILSVGWTTRYGKEFNITEGRYSTKQIQTMLDALKENKVTQPVTYPVRAGLAANDIDAIKTLLNTTSLKSATLTIWSSEGDSVDVAKLSKLITEVGVNKVYVDVPEDLKSKLNLSAASTMSPAAMMNLGVSMALLVLARML